MTSILISIKKLLGISEEDTSFDMDIIFHINTVLMSLYQLGLSNFIVTDSIQTWTDLLGERSDLESVKTYIFLKVKLMFDPPGSSVLLDSMQRQISELEWRIQQQLEEGVS